MNETKFAAHVAVSRPILIKLALRCLDNNHDEAEDLVQQVLCRSWRYRDSYDPSKCSFTGWCKVQLHHMLWDQKRHPKPQVITQEDVEPLLPADVKADPAAILLEIDTTSIMLAELHGLSRAVLLCALEGLTEEDGAQQLGISKSMYSDVLHGLRPIYHRLFD